MALASVVVFLVTAGGWVVLTYLNGKINQIALDLGDGRPEGGNGATTFLLVGTDSRANSGGAYGEVEGQRSDTTILAHIGENNSVTMLSIPRDTYVEIPAYTDADGVSHPTYKNKFNSAISDGGPSLLVRTVEEMTGLRIDHYVSMDLEGFKAITDAIGGVQVCVLPSDHREFVEENGRTSTNINDPMSGFVGGPGQVQVNGEMALAFVRQRHGLPNGDIDRIKRQQHFMGAVFNKIITGGVLTSPVRLEGLLSTATSALTLDDNTDILDLRKLASRIQGISSGAIGMQTLPTHAPTRAEGAVNDRGEIMIGGQRASVQFYDKRDLEDIVAPIGGTTGVSSTGDGSPTTVLVFNGSTVPGLAASAVDELTAAGFPATNAGNAATSNYVTTRILYGSRDEAAANQLHARIPEARLTADASVDGVQLILGSSFEGLSTDPPPAEQPAALAAAGDAGAGGAPEPAEGAAPVEPSSAPPPAPDCVN